MMVENMSKKLSNIQQLIARNKASETQRYMNFPFLIVEPSSLPRTNLAIKMQSDLHKLSITSNHEIHIYGDLEIISMIDASLKPVPAPVRPSFTLFQRS
jgi:hypothetical protein